MNFFVLLIVYLILINIFAVLLTYSDKRRARKGKFRIKESSLFLTSLLGGSVFMYVTMLAIRHKTRHLRFMIGIPVIILLQLAVFVVIYGVMFNV